jgi:hypothetical protein
MSSILPVATFCIRSSRLGRTSRRSGSGPPIVPGMFRSFVAHRSRNGCYADGEQLFVRPAAAVEMDAAPTYAEGRTIRLGSHPNLRSHEATQSACVRGQGHLLRSILMLLAFRPPSVVLVEQGRWGGLFGTMVRLIIKVSLRHIVPYVAREGQTCKFFSQTTSSSEPAAVHDPIFNG